MFCAACVVSFQGKNRCGPCKNFRARGLHRTGRLAPLAVLTLVVALVTGPLGFCLSLLGVNTHAGGQGSLALTIVLSLVGAALLEGPVIPMDGQHQQCRGGRSGAGCESWPTSGATSGRA